MANRRLGRRKPHEWPSRRPDLTPGEFYLWGYTMEELYKAKPRTLEDLEARIQDVLNHIPDDVQQKVAHSIHGYLRKLVEAAGVYIESWAFDNKMPCNKAHIYKISITLDQKCGFYCHFLMPSYFPTTLYIL